MASLDPGDEVVIPTPYWTSYSDIVQICEGKPVLIACDASSGFRLTAEKLEAAITPRTRWVLLNSPSNPSGAAYGAADYRPLLEVLLRHPHVDAQLRVEVGERLVEQKDLGIAHQRPAHGRRRRN